MILSIYKHANFLCTIPAIIGIYPDLLTFDNLFICNQRVNNVRFL